MLLIKFSLWAVLGAMSFHGSMASMLYISNYTDSITCSSMPSEVFGSVLNNMTLTMYFQYSGATNVSITEPQYNCSGLETLVDSSNREIEFLGQIKLKDQCQRNTHGSYMFHCIDDPNGEVVSDILGTVYGTYYVQRIFGEQNSSSCLSSDLQAVQLDLADSTMRLRDDGYSQKVAYQCGQTDVTVTSSDNITSTTILDCGHQCMKGSASATTPSSSLTPSVTTSISMSSSTSDSTYATSTYATSTTTSSNAAQSTNPSNNNPNSGGATMASGTFGKNKPDKLAADSSMSLQYTAGADNVKVTATADTKPINAPIAVKNSIGKYYSFTSDESSVKATLVYSINKTMLDTLNYDAKNLRWNYYDTSAKAWASLDGSVLDSNAMTLTYETNHFSDWTVAATGTSSGAMQTLMNRALMVSAFAFVTIASVL